MPDHPLQTHHSAVRAYNATATMPLGTALTVALAHGALQSMAHPMTSMPRLNRVDGLATPDMAAAVAGMAQDFFYHLVNKPYTLDEPLIELITNPKTGLVFDTGDEASPNLPAIITFVGQFIDHDLTLNAVNLLDPQAGPTIPSQASPLIDLDNLYGPRLDDDSTTKLRDTSYDPSTGHFILNTIQGATEPTARDVPRKHTIDPDTNERRYAAQIADKRNDDNQILLQVHILLMRLNNAFVAKFGDPDRAKRETIRHWQSFVATGYLPMVAREDEIARVTARLGKPGTSGPLHARLAGAPLNRMPHEFAIGFRFGHSQLRSHYTLQNNGLNIPLFDKDGDQDGLYDLRGSKALASDHVIEWPTFLSIHSNLIDAKITQVVFDLPTSAIPDHVKTELNLPRRNLLRSNNLGLCAGEDLLDAYNARYGAPSVAPVDHGRIDPTNSGLFQSGGVFRTPLWYYLLREAERDRVGDPADGRLGHLGSLLVAEVILTAIADAEETYWNDPNWTSSISPTHTRAVTLADIINFVGLGPV